jgi:hypothetical protein
MLKTKPDQKKEEKVPIDVSACNAANERRCGVKGVYDLFEDDQSAGDVRITRYIWDDRENFLYNMRAVRDGASFMRMHDGGFVRMHVAGELMMSDTVMERGTNYDFIYEARGRVLIAVLGIGMVLRNILEKPEIEHVTVVELSPHVIALVGEKFKSPKLTIVQGDIFEYKTAEKFDALYFDIWPSISVDNLEEIKKLHNKFKHKKNPGAYMDSWMKTYLQKKRAQDARARRWW